MTAPQAPAIPDGVRRVSAAESPSRGRRLRGPLLLAGALLAASVLLHLRDPHRHGSYGLCPWLLLTGTYCPGCGGLRAVNDLTRGDLSEAASSNLLFIASAPLLTLGWLRLVVDRWRGRLRFVPARTYGLLAIAFVVLALGFSVLRNLPAGAWLAP